MGVQLLHAVLLYASCYTTEITSCYTSKVKQQNGITFYVLYLCEARGKASQQTIFLHVENKGKSVTYAKRCL